MCSLVCRNWAKILGQPSAVWSTLSIQLPVRDAVFPWVKQRASAVASIDMSGRHFSSAKPAWVQEAEGVSS